MRALDANFDVSNFQPYFPHPWYNEQKVFVIFDACHKLKLMRNTFSDLKALKERRFASRKKLRRVHIRYWKMKLKVDLVAQTLSS